MDSELILAKCIQKRGSWNLIEGEYYYLKLNKNTSYYAFKKPNQGYVGCYTSNHFDLEATKAEDTLSLQIMGCDQLTLFGIDSI